MYFIFNIEIKKISHKRKVIRVCDKNKNIKCYIIYSFYTKNLYSYYVLYYVLYYIYIIIYIIISRYIKRKYTRIYKYVY